MRIDAIAVGARHRRDMGDIDGLARSISDLGLLHPVVVTPAGDLIAGARRLVACTQLGWADVPVTVVSLDDLIRGESAENSQRKDWTPSEAVAIGRATEEMEMVKARAREREGRNQYSEPSVNVTEGSKGETRDIVGRRVGMSGPTYSAAKMVVREAETDPETFGAYVEEMDRTGQVWSAYRKASAILRSRQGKAMVKAVPVIPPTNGTEGVKKTRTAVAERHARIVAMVGEGHRDESIAAVVGVSVDNVRKVLRTAGVKSVDQKIGRGRALDSNRTMEGIVAGVDPGELAVRTLDWSALDRDRLADWDTRLTAALGAVTRLRARLREEMA